MRFFLLKNLVMNIINSIFAGELKRL
jgi:hypothetical protein